MTQQAAAPSSHRHAVTFYDHDPELVDSVASFVAEGLALDERVVVVLTSTHRAGLEAELRARGIDPAAEHAAQRYVALDAEMTLGAILIDGHPDPQRFAACVGGFVTDARNDGSDIRFFGEMVALLVANGDVPAAIALERLWNQLLEAEPIELLCSYPSSVLNRSRLADLASICTQHGTLVPPASYVESDALPEPSISLSRTFLPAPESVSLARRFVTGIVHRWREHDLAGDATLVASELATNAVLHARSPFRVSIDRSVGVVCISVQDAGHGSAEQQVATVEAANGRGMAIIEALSRRWGTDHLPGGKVVWAELGPTAR